MKDPLEAAAHPHRAVLSALAHAEGSDALEVAQAAILGLSSQPEDVRIVWETAILAALDEAARAALEAWMNPEKFPIEKTWVYKKGEARGRAEGEAHGAALGEILGEAKALLRILVARGLTVSESARERILACTDKTQLEAWLDRAATASSAKDVLGDG